MSENRLRVNTHTYRVNYSAVMLRLLETINYYLVK